MDLKILLFKVICIFHILIWLFILLAFLNKKLAKFNLYILIPAIYIIHILPFHLLSSLKESMYKDDWEEKADSLTSSIIVLGQYTDIQKVLDKFCFASPFSPQGMLILGAITSAYALKR